MSAAWSSIVLIEVKRFWLPAANDWTEAADLANISLRCQMYPFLKGEESGDRQPSFDKVAQVDDW